MGYQCSNFYRKLLKDGDVVDPSYGFDEDGQLKQLFADRVIDEGCIDESDLRLEEIWTNAEVAEIEEQINRWLRELHPGIDTGPSYAALQSTRKRKAVHTARSGQHRSRHMVRRPKAQKVEHEAKLRRSSLEEIPKRKLLRIPSFSSSSSVGQQLPASFKY